MKDEPVVLWELMDTSKNFRVLRRMRNRIQKTLTSGRRSDGREFQEFREISVKPNVLDKTAGSAEVRLGDTHVIVGVKVEIGTPFEDTPGDGVLICNAEPTPVAHSTWEPGPPGEEAIEVARVVDRGLRSAESLNLNDLCIIPGEKVYLVFVDLYILNYAGNLIDASAAGAVAALSNAQKPAYKIENGEIELKEIEEPLRMVKKPVALTFVKIGKHLILDPTEEEEDVMDTRLTITLDDDGNICNVQKSGSGSIMKEEIDKCIRIAIEKAPYLRSKIVNYLK